MARTTVMLFADDTDGTKAVQTVTFGLDGKAYEIDLSEENAAQLRSGVHQFVEKARRTGGRLSVVT